MKTIVFDLDNTIIDFIKFKKMAIDAAISAMIDAGLDNKKAEKVRKEIDKIYRKKGWNTKKFSTKHLKK